MHVITRKGRKKIGKIFIEMLQQSGCGDGSKSWLNSYEAEEDSGEKKKKHNFHSDERR